MLFFEDLRVNIHFSNKWKHVQRQKSVFEARKAHPKTKTCAQNQKSASRTPATHQPPRPPGAPKQKRTIAEPLHGKVDCSFCYFCGEMLVVRDGNDGHAALFGFG